MIVKKNKFICSIISKDISQVQSFWESLVVLKSPGIVPFHFDIQDVGSADKENGSGQ